MASLAQALSSDPFYYHTLRLDVIPKAGCVHIELCAPGWYCVQIARQSMYALKSLEWGARHDSSDVLA